MYLKDVKRRWFFLAVLLILIVPLLTGFDIIRNIAVVADGQRIEIRTNKEVPEQIIREAGFTLETGDTWQLKGANKNIQDGSVIEVIRGIPVTVVRGGVAKEYKSSKNTVGEALKSIGISYNKNRIFPYADTKLSEGMRIYVLDKNEELHLSKAEVAPSLVYEDDNNLAAGTEAVKTQGKAGVAHVVSRKVKQADGSHVIEELGRIVTEEPENKIIRRGTARSVKTPNGYKRYTKLLQGEATAYIATGNRTSLGLVPHVGIVAVDPRVIPYYTKMYIPGYGIAMAGDTGGDIVGNRVDLFFDSYQAAMQWGRRPVEIYILEE